MDAVLAYSVCGIHGVPVDGQHHRILFKKHPEIHVQPFRCVSFLLSGHGQRDGREPVLDIDIEAVVILRPVVEQDYSRVGPRLPVRQPEYYAPLRIPVALEAEPDSELILEGGRPVVEYRE